MSTVSQSLPPIAGMLSGHVGNLYSFFDLARDATVNAIAVTMTDVSASAVTVGVTDGTTLLTVDITAGQTYARDTFTHVYPLGATLQMTVVAADPDGMGLSGSMDLTMDTV